MLTDPASAAADAAAVEAAIARVDVRPWTDTLAAGERLQLRAVASDADGNEVTGVSFEWTTNRSSVATVDEAGVVSAVGNGLATITAAAGGYEGYAAIHVAGSAPGIARVSITPSTDTVAVGRSAQLVATAVDESGEAVSGLSYVWSSSDGGVATVTSSGVVTGIAAGTATITASAGGALATASILVLPVGEPVAGVRVLPWRSNIDGGETLQLRVVLTDASGNELSGREVAWSTNRPNVATVDGNGLVTGLSSGLATITATSEGQSGYGAVRVNGTATAVASVDVTPSTAGLQVGGTVALSAVARDAGGATLDGRTFEWTSSNTSVATVNSSGVVTAVAAGTATITATTGGQSGSASITVSGASAVVTTVTVSPSSVSLQAGATTQLTASARDQNGNAMSGRTFTWRSSNTAVATVSASGQVSGVAQGSATITATTDGVSGTSAVSVTSVPAPTVATVTVSPNPASVETSGTVQLTATARDANGNVLSGRTFTWVSGNTAVATVSSSGVVSGVSSGTVTVTATTDGVSGTTSVAVSGSPPPSGDNQVLFFSDWRTARGNSQSAVTDGGKWNFVSAEFDQTMEIVGTSGLDFPTANAYRVIATASRSGWSELRHTSLPVPTVGQSRYYRWYMRVTMPDGLSDEQTHPIQDNYLQNWGFIIYNGGGGAGVPSGMWRPEFWAMGASWPYDRWRGPALQKNQTYRIELQVQRTATSAFAMHVRIYNSAGALVLDDDDFRSNDGAFRLSSNPTLPLPNPSALNGITAGNNGIGGNPNFPFTVSYQAGFAVCATTWCGAYTGSY